MRHSVLSCCLVSIVTLAFHTSLTDSQFARTNVTLSSHTACHLALSIFAHAALFSPVCWTFCGVFKIIKQKSKLKTQSGIHLTWHQLSLFPALPVSKLLSEIGGVKYLRIKCPLGCHSVSLNLKCFR